MMVLRNRCVCASCRSARFGSVMSSCVVTQPPPSVGRVTIEISRPSGVSAIRCVVSQGKTTHRIAETPDGREISIVTRPTLGGGWVTTHEDITEPKRAERQLAQTQRFLNTIIENAPVPIVVKEPTTQQITLVNRAYEQLLGKGRDELIGKTVHDIFHARQADLIAKQDAEALLSGSQAVIGELSLETSGSGIRAV